MQVFSRLRSALFCPNKVKSLPKQPNVSEPELSNIIPTATTSEGGCGQQVHWHEGHVHGQLLPSMLLDTEEQPLVQASLYGQYTFEGAWQVADDTDFHLYFPLHLCAFIIKGSIMTTSRAALDIVFGTKPSIICLEDGKLELESGKVLRLSNELGHHAMFKRVRVPDHSTLVDFQGHWTCYDHARCRVKRTLTIHGACWHMVSKYQTSIGLLHFSNGTVCLRQGSISINSCGILQRKGLSGALWNFVQEHPRILSTVSEESIVGE